MTKGIKLTFISPKQKVKIKNRHDKTLVVLRDVVEDQKGLAFVAHGLGGFKEQVHIAAIAASFNEAGYTTVRWDAANTIGESEGKIEEALISNYLEDLEDVIVWTKDQDFYQEPFVLCGHSLGGIISIIYTQNHSEQVKALAPVSSVISAKFRFADYTQEQMDKWKKDGYITEVSNSKPGVVKKYSWAFMEDRLKYDGLDKADKITMPVLLLVGEKDTVTPLSDQEVFFAAIPTKHKELHVIKGATHNFYEEKELSELKDVFINWISNLK